MSDLREALSAAVEEHTTTPTVETPAIDVEVTSKTVEPAKDETAAPAAPEANAQPDAPVASVDKPKSIEEIAGKETDQKTESDSNPKPPTDPRIDRAPQSWKGDAKRLWAELPLAARQEVIRRERETAKVLQETSVDRQKVASIQETLSPHMDRINEMYQGNPIAAISNLMRVERTLVSGTAIDKANLVAGMIKRFGIDIVTLDSILSGEAAPEPVNQLSQIERMIEQRMAPVQSFLQQQQQAEQQRSQQVEQEAQHTVATMAQDVERFPYFEELRDDMADIIEMQAKRGIVISLEDAYKKASRVNDDTFQAISTRQSSQSATSVALQAHQEAQRAKGASISVSGNPAGVGTNIGNPADLRGTIAAALGDSGGRI